MANRKIEAGQIWNVKNEKGVFVSLEIKKIYLCEVFDKLQVFVESTLRYGDEPVKQVKEIAEDLADNIFNGGWILFEGENGK